MLGPQGFMSVRGRRRLTAIAAKCAMVRGGRIRTYPGGLKILSTIASVVPVALWSRAGNRLPLAFQADILSTHAAERAAFGTKLADAGFTMLAKPAQRSPRSRPHLAWSGGTLRSRRRRPLWPGEGDRQAGHGVNLSVSIYSTGGNMKSRQRGSARGLSSRAGSWTRRATAIAAIVSAATSPDDLEDAGGGRLREWRSQACTGTYWSAHYGPPGMHGRRTRRSEPEPTREAWPLKPNCPGSARRCARWTARVSGGARTGRARPTSNLSDECRLLTRRRTRSAS